MSEWSTNTLQEITTKITDGSHQSPKEYSGGYPMPSVKDMTDNGFNLSNCKTISEQDYELLVKQGCRPEKGDVLIAKDGSVMKHVFVVKEKPDYVLLSSIAIVRPETSKVLPEFLSYAIKSPSIMEQILTNFVSGSGVPRIVLKDFKKVEISYPPLPEQQAIAEVLTSIDDKIDLLHRNNKTLEQMAETLFRQWFVVEAKDEWEELSLDKMGTYLNGLALQKYPYNGEGEYLNVIKIKEMNNGVSESTDKCSSDIPPNYIINDGDILFSWSGSLELMYWNGGKGALNQHLFKVSSETYPDWLMYFATKLHLQFFRDVAADKATTMGHIQRKHLTQATIKVPDNATISRIDEIISPLVMKLKENNTTLNKLVKLRDTLLPKLMSCQVRVEQK